MTLNQTVVSENTAVTAGSGHAERNVPGSERHTEAHDQQQLGHEQPQPGTGNFDGIGGGIANNHGVVTINGSRINSNFAGGPQGGGIATGNLDGQPGAMASLTVNFTQVNDNQAPDRGWRRHPEPLRFRDAQPLAGQRQHLAERWRHRERQRTRRRTANPTRLVLNLSQVDDNTATTPAGSQGPPIAAGGIANGGTAVPTSRRLTATWRCTRAAPTIVNHGLMTINLSQVNRNHAAGTGGVASGGGIIDALAPGAPTRSAINLSTVSDNTAGGVGGGVANGLPNPNMPLPGGPLTINHSLITGNAAGLGGGGIFNVERDRHPFAHTRDRQPPRQLRTDRIDRRLQLRTANTTGSVAATNVTMAEPTVRIAAPERSLFVSRGLLRTLLPDPVFVGGRGQRGVVGRRRR